jgi:hypothetical protein
MVNKTLEKLTIGHDIYGKSFQKFIISLKKNKSLTELKIDCKIMNKIRFKL